LPNSESATSATHDRLLGQLYLLMGAAEVNEAGELSLPGVAEVRLQRPGSGLYGQILDGSGKRVWRSESAVGMTLPAAEIQQAGQEMFRSTTDGAGNTYHLISYSILWTTAGGEYPFTFVLVEDLAPYHAQVARYRGELRTWLGAMTVLLVIFQAVALRWGLRPLREVAGDIADIEAGRKEKLERTYPRELEGLTGNLNALLAHERAQQQRYRNALGDLAHSLKTPLAVLHGLGRHSGSDADSLQRAVEEQVARMDHIVQYQLQRAATAGASSLTAPVAVQPLLERIIATLNKVLHDKQVQFECDLENGLVFRGDTGDLTELLGNLLDNAGKWCRGRVHIRGVHEHRRLRLVVEDDGAGIEDSEVSRILQRGGRADETIPGHGLGLAMVRDIVEAYGGTVHISRSKLGGACITVELPDRR
jgi:two-component system sensor histidine kinase PhoQ